VTSLPRKLLLSVTVFVSTIAALEVGCRVLSTGEQRGPDDHRYRWKRGEFNLTRGRDVNPDGLRDRRHEVEHPGDVQRIVFLGDSVTYGHKLEASESYPSVLERRCLERGAAVEVFNVAIPGWSTRQQGIAYRTLAKKYRPDHVVLAVCLNDVPEMHNNLARPPALLAALHRNSALVRALVRAESQDIKLVRELFATPTPDNVRAGWELTLAEIEDLAEEVRRDGASFSLIVFPFRFQVQPNAPEPAPQVVLRDFCDRHGIPFLDLLPALSALGESGFVDYDHLSVAGGEAVAEALIEARFLPFGSALDGDLGFAR
jgi:lysophospholipase L1-like esterase